MPGPTIPNQALLNGTTPLAYMGVRPTSPALFLVETRDPSTNDKNYALGTWWMNNRAPYKLWRLVNLNQGVALWILTSASPGNLLTLTSNSGGAVPPDVSGNINVVGDGVTIIGVGNPGTSTITLSAIGTGEVSTLTGNSGGAVGPTAGNINVVGDGVGITIVGNPGTHTLTVSLVNGGSAVIGLHTQDGHTVTPTAGIINVSGGSNLTTTGTAGPNTLTVSLSGITQHDVQVGGAANSLTQIANGTTGQVLTAQTGADPIWTSSGNPALTCAFSVNLQAETNISGDATTASLGATNAAVKVFDLGTNITVGGGGVPTTFTAPATGYYQFNAEVSSAVSVGGGVVDGFSLQASNGQAAGIGNLPTRNQVTNFYGINTWIGFTGSAFFSLTIGDTVVITFLSTGGAKTDGTAGGNWSGYRVA